MWRRSSISSASSARRAARYSALSPGIRTGLSWASWSAGTRVSASAVMDGLRKCRPGGGVYPVRAGRANGVFSSIARHCRRPDQRVMLLALAELEHAVAAEIGACDQPVAVLDRDIVEIGAAAGDQPARLAVRIGEGGQDEQPEFRPSGGESDLEARQIVAERAFFEDAAGRLGC